MTLGSLFDGISGFPLVASWYNIKSLWASEIDPACIRISKEHFPEMKHLGDIQNIKGYDIEPVDVITFGSPCQDMSLAGKKKGIKLICNNCNSTFDFNTVSSNICPECGEQLESTRSGLFMESIRVIKEMREKTNGEYPKLILWENVTGALQSNNGDDFQCVLQEILSLCGERLPVIRPKKWTNSGEILGDTFSIAWRVFDAQYWGVPQRRKRIFLVVNFRNQSAKKNSV